MDPYVSGKISADLYAEKCGVKGKLVAILNGYLEDRGLKLIMQPSRCIRSGEVHEIIITDENDKKAGETVNKIGYLGFFAAENSGVIVTGDTLHIDNKTFGVVLGFDETHCPNHINIIVYLSKRTTGAEAGLQLQSNVCFT